MILSIIIPMYNVSQYLEKCVNNIQIKDIEYEILMINDGSPDNSLEIANQLKKVNTRIKIFSQENKGLGGARNLGINNASGKYLLFLDADDVLVKQDYRYLKHETSDIIEYSSKNITPSNQIISEFFANETMTKLEGVNYSNNNPSIFSACNKIYANKFLQDSKLSFIEKLYLEDFEFNTRAFFYAKEVLGKREVIQHFVQVENSITRNNSYEKKIKLISDMKRIIVEINLFKQNKSLNEMEILFLKRRISYMCTDLIYHSLKNNISYNIFQGLYEELKKRNFFNIDIVIVQKNKELFRKLISIKGVIPVLFVINKIRE